MLGGRSSTCRGEVSDAVRALLDRIRHDGGRCPCALCWPLGALAGEQLQPQPDPDALARRASVRGRGPSGRLRVRRAHVDSVFLTGTLPPPKAVCTAQEAL